MGRWARVLPAAAVVAIIALASQGAASASIDAATGEIQLVAAPASVAFDGFASDTSMIAFDERQHVQLVAPLVVDFTQPGMYKLYADLQPATIPAGTVVNSQFVDSNEATKPCNTCPRQFEGTIHTDSDILGVIVQGSTLDASDFLGAPGTVYPTGSEGRKLELNANQQDLVIEELDRRTLLIHSDVRLQAADQVRIITQGDQPPVVSAGADAAGVEGSPVALAGSVVDPEGDATTASWSYAPLAGVDPGASCSFSPTDSPATSITCTDDGTYTATLTASDGINAPVTSSAMVTVSNAAPAVTITSAPQTLQQGSTASLAASVSDAGSNDTHSCSIAWGDSTVTAGTVVESSGGGTCTGSHVYSATGSQTVVVTVTDDDGAGGSASQSALVYATCPARGDVHLRWHYSVNGGAGGWSSTKSSDCSNGLFAIGPQAMEGDAKVSPGTTIGIGYDLNLPGNKLSQSAIVLDPTVVFVVRCVSGATPSAPTFTVSIGTQTYAITKDGWFPSAEQKSPLVYQGSATVPDLCAGGNVRLDKGGTFSAIVGLF
jgi:hypothetical protein